MSAPPTPGFSELVAAMKVLAPPAPAEERGIAKHASTIIVAIILALCLWVGAMIMQLSNTTGTMAANVQNMGKTLDDLSARQTTGAARMADMQASVAEDRQRLSSVEAEQQRMRERMRIVEGQKPLSNQERPLG